MKWPLYNLWQAGMLPLADFDKVTLDQVDLAVRTLELVRARDK